MSYINCLPNPRTATYEDCELINRIMKRLAEKNIRVESEPAIFRAFPAPDNIRKFRIQADVEREQIYHCCNNNYERDLIGTCIFSCSEKGVLTFHDILNTFAPTENKEVKNRRLVLARRLQKKLAYQEQMKELRQARLEAEELSNNEVSEVKESPAA